MPILPLLCSSMVMAVLVTWSMMFWLRTHIKARLVVYDCPNGLCRASILPNPFCGELAHAIPVFDAPQCAYWSLIAVYCLTCLCGCLAVLAFKPGCRVFCIYSVVRVPPLLCRGLPVICMVVFLVTFTDDKPTGLSC